MISRRNFTLQLGATGLTGAGLALTGLPVRAGNTLDLNRRADFLQAVIKMRGSTDDRLCVGWVQGTRYAVVEHRAIPMMGLLAATFTQYRRRSADAYTARSLEVAYFLDLDTRKLLETWRNPVTDRVVEVPKTRMGPSQFTITADGLTLQRAAGEAIGLQLNHAFKPAITRGNDVWVTEVINVGGAPGSTQARHFVYNEMTTYRSRLSDLADPSRASVPTDVAFHGLVTYRPWMGFGDTPGHTTAHGAGTRAASVAELPEYYLALTREFHPDVLEDPLAVLADESA
jgi:hypothetical protein